MSLHNADTDVKERDTAPGGSPGKSAVIVDTNESRVVQETIDVLAEQDLQIYKRGGSLVRVVEGDKHPTIDRATPTPVIFPVSKAHLRERITRVIQFWREDPKNGRHAAVHPPKWLVEAIADRGEWPRIQALQSVSTAPILRPDGTVHDHPGYDPATATVYWPLESSGPRVPDHPTDQQICASRDRLLRLVCDMPFANEASRSAWLAALLTVVGRFAFEGPAPGFLFDGNTRGSGKSLAARLIGLIVLGAEPSATNYAHSEEFRKKVTAFAKAGDPLVFVDNLNGELGNDALDRALTATVWSDRTLGTHERIELPLLATWFFTGNNVAVGADTARRLMHVRFEALTDKPEERSGFTYPDVTRFTRENRPQLLADALLILSSYMKANTAPTLSPFGGFEGWSRLVRGAIVWLGLPDPCGTRATLEEIDDSAERLSQLLDAWSEYLPEGKDVTAKHLIQCLYPANPTQRPRDRASELMRDAIESVTETPDGKIPEARQLGNRLKSFYRRVQGGRYLDYGGKGKHGKTWRLCRTRASSSIESVNDAEKF